MKQINAGKYNKVIEILSVEKVTDKATTFFTTYANVKTTRGFTLIQNDSDFEKAYTNFTIRYPNVEITRDMYIKFNSKIYTIEYLNNVDEANVELEIQAKEIDK